MSHARMTLMGMIETLMMSKLENINDTWELDSERFDKEVLLSTIIMKGGRFEPLYTNPTFFKYMCDQWWKKWSRTFNKWWTVFDKEYEPLWDRNGFEEVEDHTDEEGTLDTATSETRDNDTTYSKTGSNTEVTDDDATASNTNVVNGTVENQVSAYDATDYQAHDKTITNTTTTDNGSSTDDKTVTTNYSENGSGTDDTTTSGTVDTDTTGSRDYTHSMHSWGNWGISQTSQKLLASELEVQAWNEYDHMADLFIQELLLTVY